MTADALSGITTYSYDQAGNRRSLEAPSGDITTYTWNGQNQLIQVELPDDEVVTYTWAPVNKNAEERMVTRDDGVDVQQLLWDNNNVVRETDDLDTVQAEYTYQPQPYGDLVSEHRDADSSFYRFDALGSTTGLTDDAGNTTDEYRYTAFGKESSASGTNETPYRWVGELGYRQDDATGLNNLRARDYDPQAGRFVSQDPLGLSAGDSNFYRYVGNSPTNAADPSGLSWQQVRLEADPMTPGGRVYLVIEDLAWTLSTTACHRIPIGTVHARPGFSTGPGSWDIALDAACGGCTKPYRDLQQQVVSVFQNAPNLCGQPNSIATNIVQMRIKQIVCEEKFVPGENPKSTCKAAEEGGRLGLLNLLVAFSFEQSNSLICERDKQLQQCTGVSATDQFISVSAATLAREMALAVVSGGTSQAAAAGSTTAKVGNAAFFVRDTYDTAMAVDDLIKSDSLLEALFNAGLIAVNTTALKGSTGQVLEDGKLVCKEFSKTLSFDIKPYKKVPAPGVTPGKKLGEVDGHSIHESEAGLLYCSEPCHLMVPDDGAGNATPGSPTNSPGPHPSSTGPVAGGGANLNVALTNMTADDVRRIQNAANRIGIPISLVGSRAGGAKLPRADSDWDYVIQGNYKKRASAAHSLPGAKSIGNQEPWNQDVFKGPLDCSRPYITFFPE